MKKKWILITIIIAALTIGGIASAQVTAPNLWKIVSGSIRPVVNSWELGAATSRIQKGWFTNLDASNATIGSIAVSGTVSGDMVVGGQIRAANGTSTAPAYSFNSDTNTGLMWTGNDAFKFINGGNDSLSVSSAGQVKINALASSSATLIMADTLGNLYSSADNRITSASSPLVLAANNLSITKASSTASGYLSNTDWSTFNAKVSSQWTTSGSNISYTAGSVGIGTTAPTSPLTVSASSTGIIGRFSQLAAWTGSNYALYVDDGDYSYLSGFRIETPGGLRSLFAPGGQAIGFATAGDSAITFTQSTSVERMRIAAGGNVGIGTTTPQQKLHVIGNIIAGQNDQTRIQINANGGIAEYYLSEATPRWRIFRDLLGSRPGLMFNDGVNSSAIASPANANIALYTGGTERLRVDSAGNIGIGTTAPGEKLEVNGNIKATGYKSSDGTIGTSTTINVRKADDSGACTITVKNGLVTATTCP